MAHPDANNALGYLEATRAQALAERAGDAEVAVAKRSIARDYAAKGEGVKELAMVGGKRELGRDLTPAERAHQASLRDRNGVNGLKRDQLRKEFRRDEEGTTVKAPKGHRRKAVTTGAKGGLDYAKAAKAARENPVVKTTLTSSGARSTKGIVSEAVAIGVGLTLAYLVLAGGKGKGPAAFAFIIEGFGRLLRSVVGMGDPIAILAGEKNPKQVEKEAEGALEKSVGKAHAYRKGEKTLPTLSKGILGSGTAEKLVREAEHYAETGGKK